MARDANLTVCPCELCRATRAAGVNVSTAPVLLSLDCSSSHYYSPSTIPVTELEIIRSIQQPSGRRKKEGTCILHARSPVAAHFICTALIRVCLFFSQTRVSNCPYNSGYYRDPKEATTRPHPDSRMRGRQRHLRLGVTSLFPRAKRTRWLPSPLLPPASPVCAARLSPPASAHPRRRRRRVSPVHSSGGGSAPAMPEARFLVRCRERR